MVIILAQKNALGGEKKEKIGIRSLLAQYKILWRIWKDNLE